MNGFVCAFRGRRDAYQVPIALAEAGLLDQFVTDAYPTRAALAAARLLPAAWRGKLARRAAAGLPPGKVKCLWGTTALEHARHRLGYPAAATYAALDARFGQAAARRAAETRADLLLYSPYAWEAFTARYRHAPRKVLFQYHPHPGVEARILAADAALHPGVGESYSSGAGWAAPPHLARREAEVWRHSERILCASEFTARSLAEVGCDPAVCRVIPYGVDLPPNAPAAPPPRFEALFVGSGGQRKGLHHLARAWGRARLPADSRLTAVCRVLDRGVEAALAAAPRVRLLRGVPPSELGQLYAESTLFVMPSLVEGFGQVYLEALSHGLPVLGTANTCLPDLGGPGDGVHLVAPGDVDGLAFALERLAADAAGGAAGRAAARACAAQHTWPGFRQGVRDAIGVT